LLKSLYSSTTAAATGTSSSNRHVSSNRVTFEIMAGRVSSAFGIELQRSLNAYADSLASRIDDGELPVTE
jgi:hypothetical protein